MTQNEIEIAQKFIDNLPIGKKLCLREIYGESWKEILEPREFGKKFKKAVREHKLNRILHLGIRSTGRCDEYERIHIM